MVVLRGVLGVAWKGRFLGWVWGWFWGAKIDALRGVKLGVKRGLLEMERRGRGPYHAKELLKKALYIYSLVGAVLEGLELLEILG